MTRLYPGQRILCRTGARESETLIVCSSGGPSSFSLVARWNARTAGRASCSSDQPARRWVTPDPTCAPAGARPAFAGLLRAEGIARAHQRNCVYVASWDLDGGALVSQSEAPPWRSSRGALLASNAGGCGGPQRAALANSRASHGGPNCLLTALQGQILGLPRTRLQVRQRPEGHARANPQQSCPRSSAPAPSGAPQGCPGATASSS